MCRCGWKKESWGKGGGGVEGRIMKIKKTHVPQVWLKSGVQAAVIGGQVSQPLQLSSPHPPWLRGHKYHSTSTRSLLLCFHAATCFHELTVPRYVIMRRYGIDFSVQSRGKLDKLVACIGVPPHQGRFGCFGRGYPDSFSHAYVLLRFPFRLTSVCPSYHIITIITNTLGSGTGPGTYQTPQ